SISGSYTICQGENANIPLMVTGFDQVTAYYRETGGPVAAPYTAAAGTHQRAVGIALSPGLHTFQLDSVKYPVAPGCTGTVSGQTTVMVQPTPDVTMNLLETTLCRNDSTRLSFDVTAGNPSFTVYYHDSNLKKDSLKATATGNYQRTVKPAQTTSYILDSITDGTASTTGNRSCFRNYNISRELIINQLPVGKLSGDTAICYGSSTNITFDAQGQYNMKAFYTVRQVDGTLYNDSIPLYGNPTTYTVKPEDTTTYTLTALRDDNGCWATSIQGSATVIVNLIPVPVIAASDSASCPPLVTSLINLTDVKFLGTYTWTYGNGNTFSGTGPDAGMQQTYEDAGSYDVRLEVTSPAGCYKDTLIENLLVVHPFPEADFEWQPQESDIVEPTIMFRNTSSGNDENLWSFYVHEDGTADISDLVNPVYRFPDEDAGRYNVQLLTTTEFGCTDSITKQIYINGVFEVYIPNSFSPNGDGVNDVFKPVLLGGIPESYELSIFNRWGELVYYTRDYMRGWDGTANGEASKQDVYVYHLKVRSKYNADKKDEIGQVRILK
ncbi:MAG: gliding motility-associated C-terminal domain-containing protein, partial [Bacteroidota bacterium]